MQMKLQKLNSADRNLARALFTLMADVFGENHEELTNDYIDYLLGQQSFWAIAAIADDGIAGGITAHTLPMTRTMSSEIFVYDIAVRRDHRRSGVGRLLVNDLRTKAAQAGIGVVFVPVDNDDVAALDFYRFLGGIASPVTLFTFTKP
jgi:aminoglycoside 3-N-acetyltransferase I